MKLGLLCKRCKREQRSDDGLVKMMGKKRHKVIFTLMAFYFLLGVFWESCPNICLASKQEALNLGLRDMVLGVHFIDDKRGWAVGNFGLGLMTADGGETWQRKTVSDDDSFKDVFFVGEKGWIVGERGLILHTDDGGKTWKKQTSNGKSLLSVFFVDENKGFTVGSDGTILKTVDGGASWEVVDMGWETIIPDELLELGVISINLYDVFFLTETSGWIVGDAGTVLRTVDGGNEWTVAQMATLPPLFSIGFKNDKDGWAVGSHGLSLKTNDGGKSWERFEIGTESSLYKIQIYNNYGVIVGDLGTILKTVDGGKTWVEVPSNLPPPYPWFADVWILPSNSVKVLSVGKSIIFNMGITSKK